MNLTAPEVARLLCVPLRTLDRWLERDGLPSTLVQQEHRIHRVELFEWAASRGLHLPPSLFPVRGVDVARCASALSEGGVHELSTQGGRSGTAAGLLAILGVSDRSAPAIVAARPRLGFVAVGGGLAVPRLNDPIVGGSRAAVAVCRLDAPLEDLDARVLLAIVTPTVRLHRALVEILYLALDEEPFRSALCEGAPVATLVARLAVHPARAA